jgi:hypothetical protein
MDSLMPAVLVNILFFFMTMGTGFALHYAPDIPWLTLGIALVYFVFISQYLLIAALYARSAGGKTSFGVREMAHFFRTRWVTGLQLLLVLLGLAAVGFVSLPFYFSLGGIPGAIGAALTSWVLLLAFMSLLFLCPLLVRGDNGFVGSVKKSFLLAVNNPGLTFFSSIVVLLQLIISAPFLFIIPGLSAVMLFSETLVSLMEKKYGWIASRGKEKNARIPWKDLLEPDSKDLNRNLLDAIFPFRKK